MRFHSSSQYYIIFSYVIVFYFFSKISSFSEVTGATLFFFFNLPHSVFTYQIENTVFLITSYTFPTVVLNVVSENISNITSFIFSSL